MNSQNLHYRAQEIRMKVYLVLAFLLASVHCKWIVWLFTVIGILVFVYNAWSKLIWFQVLCNNRKNKQTLWTPGKGSQSNSPVTIFVCVFRLYLVVIFTLYMTQILVLTLHRTIWSNYKGNIIFFDKISQIEFNRFSETFWGEGTLFPTRLPLHFRVLEAEAGWHNGKAIWLV